MEWFMSQLGEGRVGRNKQRFVGRATAALLLAVALCQAGIAQAAPHGGGGGFHGGGFHGGAFHGGAFRGGGFGGFHGGALHDGFHHGFRNGASTAAAFEGSAAGFLAGWDGPTIHTHMNGNIPMDGIIIRATATIPDNTGLRETGIIAPTRQVITRM
jgi:hypothetical protein